MADAPEFEDRLRKIEERLNGLEQRNQTISHRVDRMNTKEFAVEVKHKADPPLTLEGYLIAVVLAVIAVFIFFAVIAAYHGVDLFHLR